MLGLIITEFIAMQHSTSSNSIFLYLTKEEYFRLAEEVEKENLQKYRNKKRRIESKYKDKQAKLNFIYALEEKWDEYIYYGEEDFTPFYDMLQKRVEFMAKNRAKYWNGERLSYHDFESAYWEEIWRIIKDYDGYGEFYLYETILLAIKRRSHDVTRKATKKGNNRVNHLAEAYLSILITKKKKKSERSTTGNRLLFNAYIGFPKP